jgi:VanZ family protein
MLWACFVFVLLILPSQDLNAAPKFEGFDKLAHCGTFFVLAALLYWQNLAKNAFRVNRWDSVLKVLASPLIFAVATELAQLYLTDNRTADFWDFFADAMGIGMATFAYILFYKKRQ